ncbi:MAG: repressor LexA [Chloroflexota bacterium]|nr:MAG: repressor LexA [Chloroflexota bacterium]
MTTKENPSQKQKSILSFIWQHQHNYGRPPSYREIGKVIGINSPSNVKYHLDRLEMMGFLRRDKDVPRCLLFTDKAITLLGKISETIRAAINYFQIPISGDIAAGEPVSFGNDSFGTYDEDDVIVVNADQLPRQRSSLYALRVRGHSMIDALVDDGDIVILQKVDNVRNGDMVAAWLPLREELTLKHYFREGKETRLQPANPDFEPIVMASAEVEVQGKVIVVQRQMFAH